MNANALVKPTEIPKLLEGVKEISVDTETTGLQWWKDQLVYLTFSRKEHEGFMVDMRKFVPEVAKFLADPGIGKIFHKAQFDVLFLEQNGYKVNNTSFDTKIGA